MVVAIVAILSAVAFPSFVLTTKKFRVSGEAASFASDLQLARSEAIKRGLDVKMCPTNGATPPTCSTTSGWQNGWRIYTIASGGDTVEVKEQGKWSTASRANTDTLAGDIASPYVITFNRDGYAQGLPSAGYAIFKANASPAIPEVLKCIVLTKAGRQKILKSGEDVCS